MNNLLLRRRWSRGHGLGDGRSWGFTVLEMMVVVIIVGILAALLAPGFLSFWISWNILIARDQIHGGIRQAQEQAVSTRRRWRLSLREGAKGWEWAAHPDDQPLAEVRTWSSLSPLVTLDPADTTLRQQQGVYFVRFGHRGEVLGQLGTITVTGQGNVGRNQCVIVSTLLGTTRRGTEHPTPRSDRYCY